MTRYDEVIGLFLLEGETRRDLIHKVEIVLGRMGFVDSGYGKSYTSESIESIYYADRKSASFVEAYLLSEGISLIDNDDYLLPFKDSTRTMNPSFFGQERSLDGLVMFENVPRKFRDLFLRQMNQPLERVADPSFGE